ncbi:MAG: TetR family transcriptional regulator, partial [Acinetobacter sp.]
TNILINLSFTWAMSWISLERLYSGIELELQKMVLQKQAVTQIRLIFKGIENWDTQKDESKIDNK